MRALLLCLLLTGCISTAVDIITAPVRIVGAGIDAGVDAVTTSQEEADRNRGRALREAEEAEAKAQRRAEKARKKAAQQAERP